MIRYFCDVCECETNDLNTFAYLCHIDNVVDGSMHGYVDGDLNLVSGRSVGVDLCNACYNEVAVPSVVKLRELTRSLRPDVDPKPSEDGGSEPKE